MEQLMGILPFLLMIVIFYFMIMRPQQKRAKEREKMLSEVQKGDKIITGSGMHGTVVNIDEKTFLLQVDSNVKLKFERTAIASVVKSSDNS